MIRERSFISMVHALLLLPVLLVCCAAKGQPKDREFGLRFTGNSVKLNAETRKTLDRVVDRVVPDTTLSVQIAMPFGGCCAGCGPRSWKRVNNIFTYLTGKGLRADRITNITTQSGDLSAGTVSIVKWEPMPDVPAPHPNLRNSH